MKATLSQDHVAATLDEYQCLFLRLSLGSLSKPEPQTKKTIKQSGNLNQLALHFVNKGMEAK